MNFGSPLLFWTSGPDTVKQPTSQISFSASGLDGSLKSIPHSTCYFLKDLAVGLLSWGTLSQTTKYWCCQPLRLGSEEWGALEYSSTLSEPSSIILDLYAFMGSSPLSLHSFYPLYLETSRAVGISRSSDRDGYG